MNILISFIESFNRANNLKLFITLEEAKPEFVNSPNRCDPFVRSTCYDIKTNS